MTIASRSFCLLLMWLVTLPMARAETVLVQSRTLVAEVRLDDEPFLDTLYLQETDDHLLLPMGELARLLGIGVTVDADGRGAAGFILDERVEFRLALDSLRVRWGTYEESFPAHLVRWMEEDLHVELHLLQRWWPIDLNFDRRSLVLHVRAREKLPVRLRMEREAAARRANFKNESPARANYPLVTSPHRWWSVPSMDNLVSLGVIRGESGVEVSAAYSATLAGDFLGMETMANASLRTRHSGAQGLDEVFRDLRVMLARHDPQGRLLGKLGATSLQLGQIALPAIRAVTVNRAAGWGALVSNRPLDRPSRYGVQTLRGWLPEGWDVALFFNDRLTGFAVSSAAGVYEFLDQPLFFGRNEFRLEFNGPQGQRRTETTVYWLDETVTEPGAAHYTAGVQRDESDRVHSLLQWDLGLMKGLAMSAAAVHTAAVHTAGMDRDNSQFRSASSQGHLGIRSSVFGARVDVDHGWGTHGERATELNLTTRIGGVSVNASRSWREASGDAAAGVRDEWRVSGASKIFPRRSLPYTLTFLHDRMRGKSRYEIEPRFYLNLSGLNLSQSLRLHGAEDAAQLHGSTQLLRYASGWALGAQFAYRVHPALHLEGVTASLVRNLDDTRRLNLGLSWADDPRAVALSLAWWRRFRTFGLGVNVKVSESGSVDASLQWSSSLTSDPHARGVLRDAQSLATMGAVAARVFLDQNGNGLFDEGEEPLEDARFMIDGGVRPEARTDAKGEAVIARLRVNAPTDIALEPTSLEDAQWQPFAPGVRVVPRAGRVQRIDFPVVATSEVEGVVMRRGAAQVRPLGAIRVQLVNEHAQVEQEVRTSGDGYFVIDGIKPGRYRLRPDPAQLAGLGLEESAAVTLELGRQGAELRVVEFFLVPAVNRSGAETAAPPYLHPEIEMVVSRK